MKIKNDDSLFIFSHPDYTVGFGISPNPDPNLCRILRFRARGLYRRSGISPCPEDHVIYFTVYILYLFFLFVKGFSKKEAIMNEK